MAFIQDANAVSSVYWIHHPDHTDIFTQGYVGITKRFKRRMWEHLSLNGNRYLKHAINKYGWDALVKEKVVIAKEDYCLNIEAKLRSREKTGWNLIAGGNKPPITRWNLGKKGQPAWNKGLTFSDETKAKISQASKEQWQRPGMRELLSNLKKGKPSNMAGKKHSPETIEKLRLVKTGKPSGKKGMKMSQEHNDRMKELIKSQPWTCPHCNKQGLSKGAANRWHFDNCKGKI